MLNICIDADDNDSNENYDSNDNNDLMNSDQKTLQASKSNANEHAKNSKDNEYNFDDNDSNDHLTTVVVNDKVAFEEADDQEDEKITMLKVSHLKINMIMCIGLKIKHVIYYFIGKRNLI